MASTGKQKFAVSTGSQIAFRLLGTGISLVTTKLIAQAFGVSGTGTFNTITTYLAWVSVVADLGLFSYGVREISRNPTQEQGLFSTLFGVRLVTALAASCIAAVAALAFHTDRTLVQGVAIASLFIFLNLTASAFDVVFQNRQAMQFPALAEFLSKGVLLAAVFTSVRSGAGLLWTVASIPLSGAVILGVKALLCRRFVVPHPHFSRKQFENLIAASLPLGIVFILNNLYFKVDTLFLYAVKGTTAVGYYSLAYKVLEVALFVGAYLTSSLKPVLSTSLQDNKRYSGSVVQRGVLALLMLSLPLSILLGAFAKPIVLLLSTSEFFPSIHLLQVLAWSIPLLYLDMLLGEVLIARGQRTTLLRIAGGMFMLILVTDSVAIPLYGAVGAAYATVGAELVLLCINVLCCRTFASLLPPLPDIARIIGSSVVLVWVAYLLTPLSLFFGFSIILASLAYAGCLYLTGALTAL